jgi:transposase InsO family protein
MDWILLWHTLCQPCQWKLFNFCQYSTNAVETISSKHCLESLAQQEGISIKTYHADNGVFASNAFKEDCASLDQKYSFSGVGAHHQNGIAEQNIKTVA